MSSHNVVSTLPDVKNALVLYSSILCLLASVELSVDVRVCVDAYIDSALCEHNLATNMAVVTVSTMLGKCTASD